MIQFGNLEASDCIYVAKHMRERDALEIGAIMPGFDPVSLGLHVFRLWKAVGVGGFVVHMDRPVAIVSITRETPRSAQATMFATDDFDKCGKSVTRHMIKQFLPALIGEGLTRIEARCWEGHEQARDWMARMGAQEEATIRGYGANGETFIQMAWSKCA